MTVNDFAKRNFTKIDSIKVFTFFFFKETDKTNAKSLKKNLQILPKYSMENDLIYTYRWTKNYFLKIKKKSTELDEDIFDINKPFSK